MHSGPLRALRGSARRQKTQATSPAVVRATSSMVVMPCSTFFQPYCRKRDHAPPSGPSLRIMWALTRWLTISLMSSVVTISSKMPVRPLKPV